jgi:hypothetical protein
VLYNDAAIGSGVTFALPVWEPGAAFFRIQNEYFARQDAEWSKAGARHAET